MITDTLTVCPPVNEDSKIDDDLIPLRCWDCNFTFTTKEQLYKHLLRHIKQPQVVLERIQLPPLKITLKSKSDKSFEIISSPVNSISPLHSPIENYTTAFNVAEAEENREEEEALEGYEEEENGRQDEYEAHETFSPNFVADIDSADPAATGIDSPCDKDGAIVDTTEAGEHEGSEEYGSIPGAEPTPPPEPSPDPYPKIRIKSSGLLKGALTITEITDDKSDPKPISAARNLQNSNSDWNSATASHNSLNHQDNDDSIISLFNNNEKAKDYGFCTTESEYISLERLEERNRGVMQLYNPVSSSSQSRPLDSLTGLPMQALAQQVSRLKPSSNGLHQQNVLINIQQFPSAPQPPCQPPPPPMYGHHPHPPQPMYQPYMYQPPNIYYPPGPGYPGQHMPPHQSHMPGMPQHNTPHMNPQQGSQPLPQPPNPMAPPSSQPQMNQMQSAFRHSMPRPPDPRGQVPGSRMPLRPRGMGTGTPRQPVARQRAPMVRGRGALGNTVRGVRPRMTNPQNGMVHNNMHMAKRAAEQQQQVQAKKKKFDVLVPDKDDDDCQVICMQPKNTDGGLPQIESVQGGTTDPIENNIMHLSDSITLSVRNPAPKPQEPKKSDAKDVANILATRGITVTATGKPKEKPEAQKSTPVIPATLNLNGAVSIVPAPKPSNGVPTKNGEVLPTVDLTDDPHPVKQPPPPAPKSAVRGGLPFRCDLCPAQYPHALGLNKHRQMYHKTNSGMCELGVPLINLKQPGFMQKLASLGIHNYIPLPSPGSDGLYALPIISTRNPGNIAALGTTQVLSLGPVRTISRPQNNPKPQNSQKL